MASARFVLDENVPHLLAQLLRVHGHEAYSAKELARLGLSDPAVLLRAAADNQTLVTINSKDFRMLHEAWTTWQDQWEANLHETKGVSLSLPSHAGILIIPQRITTELVTIVTELAAAADSLVNRLFAWTATRGWHEPKR